MLEELVPIILQVLIEHRKPARVEEIMEASGCDKADVIKCLTLLCDLDLVQKEKAEKAPQTIYTLIKELKGIHLAKAAQLGLDLSAFEGFFKVDKKEKQLALDLATQAEKIKNLELNKRKPLLQKRGYLVNSKADDISENLMLLYEATNMTVYEYIEQLAQKDPHLQLLITMHQQAESSLRDYVSSLK